AGEASQGKGNNAATWSLRAQANLGLGRYEDAVYEGRQAVALEPGNPDYLFTLAQAQEAAGHGPAAIASYEALARLVPSNPSGMLGVASVLLRNNQAGSALQITEELRQRFPRDRTVGYYYGWALVQLAEQVPRVQEGGAFVITSAAEMSSMRGLLERAKAATNDGNIRHAIQDVEVYLDRMSGRTLHVRSDQPVRYLMLACGVLLVGLTFLSVGGTGVLVVLVCLAVVAAMVAAAWVPQSKVN